MFQTILESIEAKKLLAVIYGGRFQPFHGGHYSVYKNLCHKFGKGSVWIASSDKTNFDPAKGDITPFTFEERKEIMTQMFDISPEKIIKCKNPTFTPYEILELYKGPVVNILICGDKDASRYEKSKNYKQYLGKAKWNTLETSKHCSYYMINDSKDGDQSGTSIREAFIKAGDDKSKQKTAFKKFYKTVDMDILDLIVSKIKMIKEVEPKE